MNDNKGQIVYYIIMFIVVYALGFGTYAILYNFLHQPPAAQVEVIQEEDKLEVTEDVTDPMPVMLGEEGVHIWKAKNGVLDQYADIWWRGPFWILEDEIQAKEGNFRFGKQYMPQYWWLNMSEDERELRVRLLQDGQYELAVKDFRPAEYEVYYKYYVEENSTYTIYEDEWEDYFGQK